MTLAFEIKFEGLDEVMNKITKLEDIKNLEEATRNTALKADRMIKEATPKGKYGHYTKDGEFVLRSEGIKQGGTARKNWKSNRVSDGYEISNDIGYVQYIRYAWKRVSDVVDDTFTAPKRLLTEAIKRMENSLNEFYQAQVKEKFERLWSS